MSAREGSCPGCGATLTFKSPATVLVVCPYCDSASTRSGLDLELIGKVAAVSDIDSVLALGAAGKIDKRSWIAVGFVQLDHGAGPWNEWALAFDDGTTAWLAEAQGELLLTREIPAPAKPLLPDVKPGVRGKLGGDVWVVAEVGEGRVVTARGELPGTLKPGATYAYADLRGPGDGFGTLAYEGSEAPTACFLGEKIEVAALGIDPTTVPERAPVAVSAQRLACPSCGQSIDLRHPDESKRVGCPSCGSLVNPAGRTFQAIQAHDLVRTKPRLPLGARAKFRGLDLEVLAMLVRSVRVGGTRYAWSEYLLRADRSGGYRWLVENQGHWSFVEPANVGDATMGPRVGVYRGRTFRHFQGGKATVDLVLGEVYWEVKIGETVATEDYVDPPEMLSFESTGKERVASLGHYVERAEVQAAFGPDVILPVEQGIAPHQLNHLAEGRRAWWRLAGLLMLAVVALWIFFAVRAEDRQVFQVSSRYAPAPASDASAPGAPGTPAEPAAGLPPGGTEVPGSAPAPELNVVFSEPFELTAAKANLRLRFHALTLDNGWLGIEGALVHLDSGEVRYFGLQTEHWSGTEEGEAWSEGDRDATVYLGEVPAGRYAVRLEADGENSEASTSSLFPTSSRATGLPTTWELDIRNQVPSHGRPLLLLVLLLIPPAIVSLRAFSFERRRWAESDHAPGGSSWSDDDDDEEDEDE